MSPASWPRRADARLQALAQAAVDRLCVCPMEVARHLVSACVALQVVRCAVYGYDWLDVVSILAFGVAGFASTYSAAVPVMVRLWVWPLRLAHAALLVAFLVAAVGLAVYGFFDPRVWLNALWGLAYVGYFYVLTCRPPPPPRRSSVGAGPRLLGGGA